MHSPLCASFQGPERRQPAVRPSDKKWRHCAIRRPAIRKAEAIPIAGQAQTSGPPRLPFVFSLGVTGHRSEAFADADAANLRDRISNAIRLVRDEALALHSREKGYFSDQPTRLIFVTPIADGADQVAAEVALDLGFDLQIILPFERAAYRTSFPGRAAQERFDRLLEKASCVLELPGEPEQLSGFVMAGRATVAHCDLLLAVWDGRPPRGRGGTGEIVQLAIANGTPVLHVPADPRQPSRLLWSAFDPAVLTLGDEEPATRTADPKHLFMILSALLLPPHQADERSFLRAFETERLRRFRTRIEYPLLLAAAGVTRFGGRHVAEGHCAREIEEDWQGFRRGCEHACNVTAPIDTLEEAYSWADRLATHFAQTYRSGHIFSFVFGALAVCLGLSAFMAPQYKLVFAAIEIVITLAIVLNAHIGTRNEWHRRWLDYRQLAERLRPMRSLKLLGIAAPDPPGTRTNPVPRRWIDWYAAGIWRAMACPAGSINRARAPRLAVAIADHEIAPQVVYHRRNAEQVDLLDRRLGTVATALFVATLLVSLLTLAGLALDARWVERYGAWFTLISAGFPALGTAVFGVRFQADFGGDALRSLATAETLRDLETELRSEVSLTRAADLTEQAARVMFGDLDEWRLVNQQRDLSLG